MNNGQSTVPGRPRAGQAHVGHVMHPGVISCSPDTPLSEVAAVISTRRIHCLVVTSVTGPGEQPTWGVISGLDLVGAAAGGGLDQRTAGELAATEPLTVSIDEPLERAAQLMMEHQVEHLLVIGAEDVGPVGVLSTLDIAGALAADDAD